MRFITLKKLCALICCGFTFAAANTLEKGGYDMEVIMKSGDKIASQRTDYISCISHDDVTTMAFDFIKQAYQQCRKTPNDSAGQYVIQCLDKNNQPVNVDVQENIDAREFNIALTSPLLTMNLNGRYKGQCGEHIPKEKKREEYSLTPGQYNFTVTTKLGDKIIDNTTEQVCIRSGEQIIGGILMQGQQNCKMQIDQYSRNYVALNLTQCNDLAEGESIHFSTMSKERTLSTLFEITKIENDEKIVISKFKMGNWIGECE